MEKLPCAPGSSDCRYVLAVGSRPGVGRGLDGGSGRVGLVSLLGQEGDAAVLSRLDANGLLNYQLL